MYEPMNIHELDVVVSNIFFFHPDPRGFMIQLNLRMFFRWVGAQPPTRWMLSGSKALWKHNGC